MHLVVVVSGSVRICVKGGRGGGRGREKNNDTEGGKVGGNGRGKGHTLRLKPERRKMRETPMVFTVNSGLSGPPMRPN